MLGLAFKAGKTMFGTAACEKGIKSKRIKLLIMHNSLSKGSEKHFRTLCERNDVDILKLDMPIGRAIGREYILLVGITDEGFKNAIINA